MKKFLKLTRVLLKSGIGNEQTYEAKGKVKKALLYGFLSICLVPFACVMGYLGYSGYNLMEGLNTGIILGLATYVGVFFTFFMGMTMCVGVFYNTGDIQMLLPMPIKPHYIVGAKFITMYMYNLVTIGLFVLPVYIGYGIAGECGVTYWIFTLIINLLLSITPLVYSSVITMLLLCVIKKARNKDVLTVITTGFAILVGVAVGSVTGSMDQASASQILSLLMDKGNSIVQFMGKIFPNTILAEKAIANDDGISLLLYALSTVAFVAVFLILSKFVYIKTVVEMSSAKSKSKKLSSEELDKANKKNSQIKSYFFKELKQAFRSPIYFMNCIMLSVVWPVIMVVPLLIQKVTGGSEAAGEESGGILIEMLNLNSSTMSGICMLAMFFVTMLSISFGMLSSTCISREGRNVFFMKYIPMSYEKQLVAKVLPGIAVSLVTGTVYSIIGVAAILIFTDISIPLPGIIMGVVISILACVAFNFVEVITDILKPKLEWENEQVAVKQNFIAIIPMFIILFVAIALCVGVVMLRIKLGMDEYILGAASIVLLAILSFLFYKIDMALARKRFPKY